ncbi:hypothetical protein P4G85_29115 [Bacillus cereus]|jgi:hypothetical protein|uniref:Uncharacterized protein n=2 Tax=Bacillus cereus group TaxID=86661 RepID=A0A9W5KWX2_BACCE|nr:MULTISPECIES: hypothetical protein [Bacillus]MEB8734211.1 hypothetical protein [Bacillus cereus]QQP80498.1 hypothetical protein JI729_03920 [Bacillus sp. TK-2]EJR71528.1 hypothetical protein IK5_02994 [Bacillus cereus VD154]KIU74678.1 hypothetical protein C797_10478 [Bacillus thuringiensis Sbt003]MCA1002841.1 hypothetical protein [Bacillus thuringiensis]
MKTLEKSLGDFLADRTESLEDSFIKEFYIEYSKEKIQRLTDSEQYLFEGSRGIGKTMLMKYAALKANETFGKDSVLGVWVSFEESIRLERIKVVESGIDPFLQWTMGKILFEVLTTITNLRPVNIDKLNSRLSSIFGSHCSQNNYITYSKLLSDYINILETGDIENNTLLQDQAPSIQLSKILDNPHSFKKFLKDLISDFGLHRIVLLFDEAAHVFSFTQQEKFFSFFKSLRDPQIACKVAVYPGITNYGKYFEKGQDAKELSLSWVPYNKTNVDYIKQILKKRIQAYDPQYWNLLSLNSNIIDTICICSNGNPRFAFHIIDELESNGVFKQKSIQTQKVINGIRKVLETKWKEFSTLKNRLVKYKEYINQAEQLVKKFLIPNLRDWNNKQRGKESKLSAGFYVSTSVYESIPQIFEVLAYSNLLSIDYTKKSIGQGHYGYYMSFNPSILFSDGIMKDVKEIGNISIAIENNQAYYPTTSTIAQLIDSLKFENEFHCSNTKCDYKTSNEEFVFCPKCGNKMEVPETEHESLYKILRSHNIDSLKLSDKIITRLSNKFSNIGEIYDATIDEIRMKYIQDVRAERIKNAAIEYMAG